MATTAQVAIVGAGLAGLGAALSLHAQGVSSVIYEAATAEHRFAGAIMLSPNALQILDKLGIYKQIVSEGWEFETVKFVEVSGEITDQQYLGSKEAFGYKALRIYRNTILNAMKTVCGKRGIKIEYSKKFTSIVSESDKDVTVEFADGTSATHSLLLATDGIHSKIRKAIDPNSDPIYTGILVVAGAVPRSSFAETTLPLEQPLAETGAAGQPAMLLAPQNPDCTDFLVGTQRRYPEQDRAGWARIASDRKLQRDFLLEGVEHRSPLMQSAARGIEEDSIYTWPFFVVPPLPKWHSEHGRAVCLGDAAHAVPPTMGQGANQAFEDGFSLALVLSKTVAREGQQWLRVLERWEGKRKARIGKLLEETRRMNNARLPKEMRDKLPKEDIWVGTGGVEDVRWIFESKIEEWVAEVAA